MRVIFFAVVICCQYFSSCSSSDLSRRDTQFAIFNGTQFEEFFLPRPVRWINFSQSGSCYRDPTVEHFNYTLIAEKFDFSYFDFISLQAIFHREKQSRLPDTQKLTYDDEHIDFLSPRDKALLFHDTLEKVRGGVKLSLTDYHEVNLIWIDPILLPYGQNSVLDDLAPKLKVYLEKVMRSPYMEKAPPVLFSTCMSSSHLSQLVKIAQMGQDFRAVIGSEALSPYSPEGTMVPKLYLDLKNFYSNKRINLINPGNTQPPAEISNFYRIITL